MTWLFFRYINDCSVSDAEDADKNVEIIQNQCFAGAVQTTKVSSNMLSTSDFRYFISYLKEFINVNYHFRFSFKSFSFNAEGNGSQKLSCSIKFCLIGKPGKILIIFLNLYSLSISSSQKFKNALFKNMSYFLDDNECATATDPTKLVCDSATPYQWAKP